MKRAVDEIKSIRILKARNGIALIAVLVILLVLTLLLPVLMTMSKTAVKEAENGTERQKVAYLARTGVEILIGNLKTTLKTNEYKEFYKAIEEASKTDTKNKYTSSVTDHKATFEVNRIYWFQPTEEAKAAGKRSQYLCEQAEIDAFRTKTDYEEIGYVDVTVTYTGVPTYYYKSSATATPKIVSEGEATEDGVIKTSSGTSSYFMIRNNNYTVNAVATIGKFSAKRHATVIQPIEAGGTAEDDASKLVQYTGASLTKDTPTFYLDMKSCHVEGNKVIHEYVDKKGKNKTEDYTNNSTDNGGNLCLVDGSLASSIYEISYDNPLYTERPSYAKSNLYVFSAIGDMHIKCEGIGTESQPLVLGTYPGIRWESPNAPSCKKMLSNNFASYSAAIQYQNFVSIVAGRTLQLDLGVDMRVIPARAGRLGDLNLRFWEDGATSANASLFKMLNLEGRDVVIKGRTDVMLSLFDPYGKNNYTLENLVNWGSKPENNTGKRMGTLVLTAPQNTPYTYYHADKKKNVQAGKVYFLDDVYVWLIEYNNEGSWGGIEDETVYKTGANTIGDDAPLHGYVSKTSGDFKLFKIFNKGDVYYFNNDIFVGEDRVGVSLVNWFFETQYLDRQALSESTGIWDFYNKLRQNLFVRITSWATGKKTYTDDDMHFIGNINDDKTLTVPNIEDQVYVIWDD